MDLNRAKLLLQSDGTPEFYHDKTKGKRELYQAYKAAFQQAVNELEASMPPMSDEEIIRQYNLLAAQDRKNMLATEEVKLAVLRGLWRELQQRKIAEWADRFHQN